MLNELYQSLDPVAFSAGPITIYWYGISYIVGALLTGVVMYRTQRRWGLDITIDDIMTVVVGIVFGLLIGARLFYVLFYGDGYGCYALLSLKRRIVCDTGHHVCKNDIQYCAYQ